MIKRYFDLIVSGTALVVLGPLMLILSLFILIYLGRPVIFAQERPGLNGRIFKLYKFRTMTSDRDEDDNLLPDRLRLGVLGTFLRNYSLDELPGLICVLKGDMSLVGPRPLLVDYLPLYNVRQAKRHTVRPGITGWAQVNGRNALTWEEKFERDIWYVQNQSFLLDLKILLMTLSKLLAREGITSAGEVSGIRFTGNKKD